MECIFHGDFKYSHEIIATVLTFLLQNLLFFDMSSAHACHVWFYDLLFNLRVWQRFPSYPDVHKQTLGLPQVPPLAQGGEQIAVCTGCVKTIHWHYKVLYFSRGRLNKQTTSWTFYKSSKNSKFLNLVTIIWNHHEKCIQISTNMPDIGLEICEISTIFRNKTMLYGWGNQWPRSKC